ncbi:MAG TPA: response regulator transcription factor [Polyangiaceae bacterium]
MSPRVLLVEDEDDARISLARAIERGGRSCTGAASLAEAIAAAKGAGFFDAVVTDVVLGEDEEGGIDLIGELRTLGVRAPVIVITAFADVQKTKRALNAGAVYLLEKPFRAAELLAVLDRVLADPGDVMHLVDRALSHAGLTDKEMAVARQLLKGLTSDEIARLENNSEKTIRQHVSRVYAKCGVSSRAEFFHFVFPA